MQDNYRTASKKKIRHFYYTRYRNSKQQFFALWFAVSGMNEASQQQRYAQRLPPGALYSCTSCCPIQIHLNEPLFHAAFPATIPLDDCSFKGNPLEFGHFQGNIPGSSSEITTVMTAQRSANLIAFLFEKIIVPDQKTEKQKGNFRPIFFVCHHPVPDGGWPFRLRQNTPHFSLLFPFVFLFTNQKPALA